MNPDGYSLIESKRDDLMISKAMAYVIKYIGIAGTVIEAFYAGFSIFMVACNYGMMKDDYSFLRYHSVIAENISIIYLFINLITCVINATYTLFGWLVIKSLPFKILFTVSLVGSFIAYALSLDLLTLDNAIVAMNNRQPKWYEQSNYNDIWAEGTQFIRSSFQPDYLKYKVEDIIRCIFVVIYSLIFVISFQIIGREFEAGFDILEN